MRAFIHVWSSGKSMFYRCDGIQYTPGEEALRQEQHASVAFPWIWHERGAAVTPLQANYVFPVSRGSSLEPRFE